MSRLIEQSPPPAAPQARRAVIPRWLLALAWIACTACALRPPAPAPPTSVIPTLPPGVPKRVGVAWFAGDATLTHPLTGQLVDALRSFGFEVTGPEQVAAALPSADAGELLNPDTRAAIAGQLSVEWLFTGFLEGDPAVAGTTRIRVRVVDLATGRLAWAIERGQQSPGFTTVDPSADPLAQDLAYVLELFSLDVLHPAERVRIEVQPGSNQENSPETGGARGKN